MSLGVIPYQPIAFGLEENCTLPCANWIQKIARTDRTSFQFTFGACGNTNTVLSNGDFADDGTDWIQTGVWTFAGFAAFSPVGGTGYLQHNITGQAGLYYELQFTLDVTNGTVVLFSNLAVIGSYSASGTYSVVIDSESLTYLIWYFDAALGGSLSNVLLLPVTNTVAVAVFDLDDNYIAAVPNSWLTYTSGFLTISIENWDTMAVPDGCYKFVALDPCQCSQFGFFGEDFEWPEQFVVSIGGANVTIGGGTMEVLNSGISTATVLKKDAVCVGVTYLIEYTLSGMAVGDSFSIRMGTTTGTIQTADGTYSETLTVTATNDNAQDIRYVFGMAGGLHLITLSAFSIEAENPIFTFTSTPFELKDVHECPNCTVLVEACGNGDQFNFGFTDTGFKPVIRLDATYRGSGYPSTRTAYEFATGKKVAPYARMRKAKTLLFGAPEYVHDFAALWWALDNVYIDGVLKFCEDDEPPTVSWEDEVDLGIVTWTFSDKTELTEKRPCAAIADVGCSTEGFGLTLTGMGVAGVGSGGVVIFGSNKAEAINGQILTYNG